MEFKPNCNKGGKSAYITSYGHLKPCCWRPAIDPTFENDTYDLNKVSHKQALENIDKWLKEQVTKDIKDLDYCCRFHCVPKQSHKETEFK